MNEVLLGSIKHLMYYFADKLHFLSVVILFPNCPPTYKRKTASVILFYICILLEPLLFLNRLVHFYHAHTHTPSKCVVCTYVLFLVCESRYVSVWVCACA